MALSMNWLIGSLITHHLAISVYFSSSVCPGTYQVVVTYLYSLYYNDEQSWLISLCSDWQDIAFGSTAISSGIPTTHRGPLISCTWWWNGIVCRRLYSNRKLGNIFAAPWLMAGSATCSWMLSWAFCPFSVHISSRLRPLRDWCSTSSFVSLPSDFCPGVSSSTSWKFG